KLYVYGYLNRVQSSRRLEREAGRNVELMWLLSRLGPHHKNGRRLSEGQRPWHPQRGCALCRNLPGGGSACESGRWDRRQQVQGGEQSRSELHAGKSGAAASAARRERGTLSEPARHGRPP